MDYDESECETMFGGGNAESGAPMPLVAEAEEGKLTIDYNLAKNRLSNAWLLV